MPDVPITIEATATRAVMGRFDSTINMIGASVDESTRDDSENILSRRKVDANGPIYMNPGSSAGLGEIPEGVESMRCCTRDELEARFTLAWKGLRQFELTNADGDRHLVRYNMVESSKYCGHVAQIEHTNHMEPPIFYSKAEFIETVWLFSPSPASFSIHKIRIQETKYLDAPPSPALKISSSGAKRSSRAGQLYVVI
jgi:hypothetical protein